jgi:Protein of unknown function (DUF4235)
MAEKDASLAVRALEQAAGMLAVLAAQKAARVGWRRVTGTEPPGAPDDQQVPLGQAVAWTLLFGAAITTARMIAIRYAANLLPRSQREALAAGQANSPDTPAT